jgi:undecaprenyl-diphosphatase
MTVAFVVVVIGVLAGLLAGVIVARRSAADLNDPHVRRRTIRRVVAEYPLVRTAMRFVPARRGPALAEVLVITASILVAAAVVVGATLVMIRTNNGLARADTPIAAWAAERATPRSTTVMRELSRFGGTEYVVVAALGVACYGWLRDRRWAVVLFVATTMIGQFLVSNSIKWSVDRARPTLSNLTGFSGASFPSGHAVAAAAAWTCVALLLGRRRSRAVRGALFGAAVALGVVVAGTRVALGVHWTTDVVVGLVVGWAWFALCSTLFGGHRLRTADPIVDANRAANRAEHRTEQNIERNSHVSTEHRRRHARTT